MSYKILLWDDCCHLFLSTDSGATFIQGATPGGPLTPPPNDSGQDPNGIGTLQDFWIDGAMAINDGDFNTFVGIDEDYDKTAGQGFGILAISPSNGLNLTYDLVDPEPNPVAFTTQDHSFEQNYYRGAISGGAQTILLATERNKAPGSPDWYPRISRDFGATWADVTGVPPRLTWAGAAMGSTASQVMYLSTFAGPVRKSADWGVTWASLGAGPPNAGSLSRLRCNPTGQTVILTEDSGDFWGSRDGGTTWNHIDFSGLVTISNGPSDCGVSADGQTVVVGFTQGDGLFTDWPAIFVSTDGGLTFADVSGNLQFPASAGPPSGGAPVTQSVGFSSCNVAPDGLGIIQTFIYQDPGIIYPDGVQGFITYANVSQDGGASFTLSTIGQDPYETGSDTARFSSSYIMGITPPVGSVQVYLLG